MRIVVLGAGTVGTWIADLLCQHRHSVTIVDNDSENTQRINEELDVRAVTGSASESSVLFQADILGADICLAVTGSDEVNLVSASMAKEMGARRSIARAFGPIFRDRSTFDYERHFKIDRLLSLEHLSAVELARGMRGPGSLAIESLADGKLQMQELTIRDTTSSLGKPLKDLSLPSSVRIGTIYRDGVMWIAGAEDHVQLEDRITLIGQRQDISDVKEKFQRKSDPKLGIVIAGGGETGYHLSRILEDRRYAITLMESDPKRCEFLATNLTHVTVVQADATRRAVLEEERVGSADVFAACTGDDENNIMACVEAKEIGCKRMMAIVQRPDYANVVGKLGINLAVSPRDVMAKQILSFLNKGPVISRSMLPGGNIGVFEIEINEGARATQFDLLSLPLPPSCLILAVMRHEFVRVPGANDRLKTGDLVVALVDDSAAEDMLTLFNNKAAS
ncbi:MAG: Trk system potassium transporter TrkA [Planctomycetaceae bacterium]|nr:Trk system potassium transporter TrkA [Planctomycetaceae bacterium]